MRSLPCMAMALLAVAACASKPAQEKSLPATTSPAAAPPTAAPAAIGDFGIDLSAGNSHVKPGDDFFAYANGAWFDSFAIPADHTSYGPFNTLDDLSKKRVRGIVESAAAAHAATGTPEQQIGDFYASFMDTAGIEASGLAPAHADLASIAAANSRESIACSAWRASRRCSKRTCRRISTTPTAMRCTSARPPWGFPTVTTT